MRMRRQFARVLVARGRSGGAAMMAARRGPEGAPLGCSPAPMGPRRDTWAAQKGETSERRELGCLGAPQTEAGGVGGPKDGGYASGRVFQVGAKVCLNGPEANL